MHRFKYGAFFADVCAGHQAQPANQSRAQIGYDIAVKVFAQQDVKLFGPHDQLHRSVIDDHALSLDFRIELAHFFKAFQK